VSSLRPTEAHPRSDLLEKRCATVNRPAMSAGFKSFWRRRPVDTADYLGTFFAIGATQILGIATGVLTARLLGPEGKGDLATIFWLPALMIAIGTFSLPQAIAYQVSRNPAYEKALSGVGFWLSLGLGCAEAVLLWPLIPNFLGPEKQQLVSVTRWYLLCVPPTFASLALLGVYQGRQRFSRLNVLRMVPALLYLTGLLFLWFTHSATAGTAALANLMAAVVTMAIQAGLAWKHLSPSGGAGWGGLAEQTLKQGLVFLMPTAAGIILMRLDMALLIPMVSSVEIGYYSAAMAIALGQLAVSSTLVQVSFPKVAAGSAVHGKSILLRQLRWGIPCIVFMAILTGVCSPWILRFLFGPTFLPALPMALVLTAAIAVWSVGHILDNGLRGMGHGKPGSIANGFGIICLLACGFAATMAFGATGMAFALLVSQCIVVVVLLVFLRRSGRTSLEGN
jgi:enterobacterial common antigen flippase